MARRLGTPTSGRHSGPQGRGCRLAVRCEGAGLARLGALPPQAPPSLQHQQRQADPDDPDRDERASQDDARGGGEDAGPVGPDADVESLAEEPIERAAPGEHVAALQGTVAVVLHDPAFGAHADFDVSSGLR